MDVLYNTVSVNHSDHFINLNFVQKYMFNQTKRWVCIEYSVWGIGAEHHVVSLALVRRYSERRPSSGVRLFD
jgi:hypothetical protein